MSSKDHGKKSSGQFFQGKPPDKGKGPHPSTSQSSKKGDGKTSAKSQGHQGNKGKHETKKPQINAIQQQGGLHVGESSAQNIAKLLSGLSSGIQMNQTTSNIHMTHISVNLQSSSSALHMNQFLPNSVQFPTPTNRNQDIPKKGNNPKKPDSPAELRVFTGRQESSTEKRSNISAAQNRGRGQFNQRGHRGSHPVYNSNSSQESNFEKHANFSAPQNRGRGNLSERGHRGSHPVYNFNSSQESNFEKHANFAAPQNRGRGNLSQRGHRGFNPLHNSNRGQFHQQLHGESGNLHNFGRGQYIKPAGFHHEQQNQVISPDKTRLQNPVQSHKLFANKLTQKLLINKPASSEPFFFKTQTKENEPSTMKKSVDKSSLPKVPPKPAAQYKYTKNSRPKKTKSQSDLNNENQPTKGKSDGLKKSRNRRRNKFKHEWSRKKQENKEVIPIFSFARKTVVEETEPRNNVDSDEDDNASQSHCSSDESVWTAISDDEGDNSSDESEVTSEFSVISSVKGSEFSEDRDSGIFFRQSGIISVFWDIENCPVPREKSAVDFVKLVRTTLYEGRTEGNFNVVCDVQNLNTTYVEELEASNVTVFHMSSTNKNAADTKLKSLLFEFRDFYQERTGCSVVLISGDSDFSSILNTLRFKHHIYISLICKKNARHSLIEAADRCIFYEDLVKQLPTRSRADDTEYLITVSNFPKNASLKQLRSSLTSRLKSVNCRIRKPNELSADIVLRDECARERALSLLKNFKIGDCEIKMTCSERRKTDISNQSEKTAKSKPNKKTLVEEPKMEPIYKQHADTSDKETVPGSKGAALCICVGIRLGDVTHWKNELEKLWGTSDFNLHWEGESGYFLANFKSLSKAQKAKKILQKSQSNEPSSPKFLKLIKQDDILSNFNLPSSIQDINKKKIEEHIKIIESKKEICLNKHKQTVEDQKASSKSSVPGANEAVIAKLNELNDQKVTFLNYAQNAITKINNLDLTSETIDKTLADLVHDYSRECNCLTTGLPIYAKKNIILKKIKKHQVVVIRAETGSGKSTQLTQYLWREKDPTHKNLIICTQPRKIAAISLAKHVSTQIGCALGDIVGYQIGAAVRRSANTEVLYVTDFTMLKMMVNNDLKEVSHIIVDEAHERTVYTDLLLGMIKKSLATQPDLKLIITSATIDTTIFKNYFGITDDSILEVSGRTFPIEDIWLDDDVALGWDYFKKTVDTVCSILGQEAGDVLAFVTTPLETEKAIKDLSAKLDSKLAQRVKIFQLHGKLDVQEQQKIFERTPNGMQKVVFATNCAETSVTIPGIKFVVDCGMVKESQFDVIRNMNIMSVNFVSQSSAEQRRGRAGRTQVGKCYRLYSKANYEKMNKITEPEILRVNLGQALLRLMKLGINDPLQFDFVQSPPQEVLRSSMQQLLDLNAVNLFDMSLSELGEHMSCLPLEPRLSFLVLTGIDLNIGFEAIVLASLVTVSRNIFFRTAENKSEADSKKMRFCQSESDFLTFLHVYKEWVTVPKQLKSKWCVLNCINARSLRTAHDLVNEIIHILQNEINMKISSKFCEEPEQDSLLKLIFRSFHQNLCIFSGHYRLGYRSFGVSGDLLIHPSSSLYTYGRWRPEFLVYDTILRTDQTYLINVSPVSKEIILECMDTYGLNVNLAGLETLPLTTYGISPIGKIILLRDIMGKRGIQRRILEDQIKKAIGSENTIMDVDVEKGEVKVYGPQDKFDEIAAILCPLIEKAQERLAVEEKEVFLYPELCTIISAGISVKDVVFPGEFRDLKVIPTTDVDVPSVVEKLETCGQISAVREWKNYFKVTFASPLDAKLALNTYSNEKEFTLQKIVSFNSGDNRINQYKVYVSFLRRECTGEAFVTTDPPTVVPGNLFYRDRILMASNSKKTLDIRIVGLPPNTDRHDFEKFISSKLSPENKLKKCIVVRRKVYDSTPAELQSVKLKLCQIFSEFSSQDKFTVDLKKPTSKDFRWNACIFFQNPCDGETAVNVLKNRSYIDGVVDIQMKPSLQSNLYCKREVFTAVEEQVTEALNFFKDNAKPGCILEINAVPSGENNVQIKITSNNISDISDARKAILNFLLGDQIECNGKPTLEKLFSKFGREHIKKIAEAKSKCYVEINVHKKVITIFGNTSACNSVKLEINEFLSQLADENLEEIILMSKNEKPGILRVLLSTYGHDLEGLKGACGLTNIEIDSRRHVLTVRGSNTAVTACQGIIEGIKTKLENVIYEEDSELCPVCFDKVSDQSHRLEFCGHAYCKECVLHWFQTASDFPLCCLTCESAVVLEDIQWAAKEVKLFDQEIFKKSLAAFVESREDVSYCPSPDCPMIFRISNDGIVFQCPVCNNSICTQCKELFHYGMSCSLNKLCKGDEDYSLKMWMGADPDGRKTCPSCSAPIEKNGGCNHMTCWKCKCHMCWLCLKVFPNAELVYDHQPLCPKRQV
ncbi:ATP-dependent RNA helicase DEAH12, chloroplastic [Araneus ventricosus]|uniref:ATP-dependent RNA helicase DEAH12, chloroplastic n=1 Tax=Araneus ventricosus TaxID=182803 RepID=A0A4Y2KRU7_ARAVE|nr:ATP-dependent RNA helicase DEAH12, chloroplastic [Araneus ventricosus]